MTDDKKMAGFKLLGMAALTGVVAAGTIFYQIDNPTLTKGMSMLSFIPLSILTTLLIPVSSAFFDHDDSANKSDDFYQKKYEDYVKKQREKIESKTESSNLKHEIFKFLGFTAISAVGLSLIQYCGSFDQLPILIKVGSAFAAGFGPLAAMVSGLSVLDTYVKTFEVKEENPIIHKSDMISKLKETRNNYLSNQSDNTLNSNLRL